MKKITIKDIPYHINLENRGEEAFVKRRKEKDELYYEIHIKDKKLFDKYRYILVDGKKGTVLFDTLYNFRGYNEVSPFNQYLRSTKQAGEGQTSQTTRITQITRTRLSKVSCNP